MKFIYFLIILSFLSRPLFSQVGINTTTPSPASVLDVNSSSNGVNFGGLLPPKVTPAQRDQIPVTAADDGLMVFVVDGNTRELQIFDGVSFYWQTVYRLNNELIGFLAAWEVTGLTGFGPSPFNPVEVHPSVSVGGLTRGSGVGASTQGGGATDAWGGAGFTSIDQTSAINDNKYVSFTITPTSGNTVSLSSIEPYNTRRSNNGPVSGIWQYSINGVDFYNIGTEINWGGSAAAGVAHPAINLTGISALQGLTSSTIVTFRVVSWGGSTNTGTWYINNTSNYDLVIKGN